MITGWGLVSPFGDGVEVAIKGLGHGESCIRHQRINGLVELQLPVATVPQRPADNVSAPTQFLLRAMTEALRQARVTTESERVQAFVGTCSGDMRRFERYVTGDLTSSAVFYFAPGVDAANALLPKDTQVTCVSSACSSSLAALSLGDKYVREDRSEICVVGATDSIVTFSAAGFSVLHALSDDAAKPFSVSRKGLTIGEGAACVVLERESHARQRGAEILAYLRGVGMSCDAYHATLPRPDGNGLRLAVQRALSEEKLTLSDVDLYVSHGTGTAANDAMEVAFLKQAQLSQRRMLAHKGYIGHAMGASGLMSLVMSIAASRAENDFGVPYGDWEPGLKLAGTLRGVRTGLVMTSAFGGSNAAALWSL